MTSKLKWALDQLLQVQEAFLKYKPRLSHLPASFVYTQILQLNEDLNTKKV
jgi:hypothetical protein